MYILESIFCFKYGQNSDIYIKGSFSIPRKVMNADINVDVSVGY